MKIIILALFIVLSLAQQDQLSTQQQKLSYLSTIPSLRKAAYQYRIQPQQDSFIIVDQSPKVVEEVVNKDVKLPEIQTVSRINSPTRVQHIVSANPKINDQKVGDSISLEKSTLLPQQHPQQSSVIQIQQRPQPKSEQILLLKQQPKQKPNKQLRSVQQYQLPQVEFNVKPILLQPEQQPVLEVKPILQQQKPILIQQQQKPQHSVIVPQNNRPQFVNEKLQQKQQQVQKPIYGTQFPNLGQLRNWNVNQPYVAPAHSP